MLPSLTLIDNFRRAGTETDEDRLSNDYKLISRNLDKLPRLSLANLPSMKMVTGHEEKLTLKQELQLLKNSPEKDYNKGLKSLMSRITPVKLEPLVNISQNSAREKQNAQTDRKNQVPSPFLSGKLRKKY